MGSNSAVAKDFPFNFPTVHSLISSSGPAAQEKFVRVFSHFLALAHTLTYVCDSCSAGLKVLMVCFEDRLATEWYRIYQAMETVVDSQICEYLLCAMFLGMPRFSYPNKIVL